MITKTKIEGVTFEIDDGDPNTSDIVDISNSPELCAEADEQRLQFLKRQVKSFGYRIVDENGMEM